MKPEEIQKSNSLLDSTRMLLNNKSCSDVHFKFPDGKILYAHRFVLRLRSAIFHNSLSSDSEPLPLSIELDEEPYEVVLSFLKYVYTDEYDSPAYKHVEDLMCLLDKYAIVSPININNVCEYLEKHITTEEFPYPTCPTINHCLDFIHYNYMAVLRTDSFPEVSLFTVKAILSLKRISDVHEFEIFKALARWTQRACVKETSPSKKSKREKFRELFNWNRFYAMSREEFAESQKIEPAVLTLTQVRAILWNKMFLQTKVTPSIDVRSAPNHKKDTVHFGHLTKHFSCRGKFDCDFVFTTEFTVLAPVVIHSVKFNRPVNRNDSITLTISQLLLGNILKMTQEYTTDEITLEPIQLETNGYYRISFKFDNIARDISAIPKVGLDNELQSAPYISGRINKNVRWQFFFVAPFLTDINFFAVNLPTQLELA